MAPSEVGPVVGARDLTARVVIEQVEGKPGFGRNFGFLVHDVSRLIKRRFDRKARQTGLPITRRQAAVVLYVARNEGISQAEVAPNTSMVMINVSSLRRGNDFFSGIPGGSMTLTTGTSLAS